MKKRSLLLLSVAIIFILSLLIMNNFSVIAQPNNPISYTPNTETTCDEEKICQITIYSYEKYFLNNDVWEEIDESWHECSEGYCTNTYHFNATANTDGTVSAFLNNDEFTVQLSDFLNSSISFDPTIEGSILTYQNIIEDVDLRYQYLPRQLKEEIVIKEPIADLPANDFDISFTKSGNADFNIPGSIICDSNFICKELEHSITKDEVSITIPVNFLNDADTVYPVIIDPSLTLNDTNIYWDGYIKNETGVYRRANNPKGPLFVGNTNLSLKYRAALQWNTSVIPDNADILDLNLSLYFTDISCEPGVCLDISMDLKHLEGNNDTYPDNASGNVHFFDDMGNGTVYGVGLVNPGSTGWQNITINNDGKQDFEDGLADDEFNFGFRINQFGLTARFVGGSNVLQSVRPSMIVTYSTVENLVYDANGNLIEGFDKLMTYDGFNRLVRVNNSNGSLLADYAYDHEGNRVKKVEYGIDNDGNNQTTYYIDESFIQIRNTNGTIFNETYFHANGKQLAKKDNDGNIFFYHPDHLGSTTLVTNEGGDVVEEVFYLPYGGLLDGGSDERFLFTGKERDSDTGFDYFGARYYDSDFRHFIQPDAIIQDIYNPQDLNRYAYVRNNPYKYVDPGGELAVSIEITTLSGAGDFLSGTTYGLASIGNPTIIGLNLPKIPYLYHRPIEKGTVAPGTASATINIGISPLITNKEEFSSPTRGGSLATIAGRNIGVSFSRDSQSIWDKGFTLNLGIGIDASSFLNFQDFETGEARSIYGILKESLGEGRKEEGSGFRDLEPDENLIDFYNQFIYRPIPTDGGTGPDGVINCYHCGPQFQDRDEDKEGDNENGN